MIYSKSCVIKKAFNKNPIRVCIDSIKVGDYIRTIKLDNGVYSLSKIKSIVKLTLPRYELYTTCLDTIICSPLCEFMTLDGLAPWQPTMNYDHSTRLCKRESSKLLTPFIVKVKQVGNPTVFYDILLENKDEAILVDGYAKLPSR